MDRALFIHRRTWIRVFRMFSPARVLSAQPADLYASLFDVLHQCLMARLPFFGKPAITIHGTDKRFGECQRLTPCIRFNARMQPRRRQSIG